MLPATIIPVFAPDIAWVYLGLLKEAVNLALSTVDSSMAKFTGHIRRIHTTSAIHGASHSMKDMRRRSMATNSQSTDWSECPQTACNSWKRCFYPSACESRNKRTDTPREPRTLLELFDSWGPSHLLNPNEPGAFNKLASRYSDLLQLIHRHEARLSEKAAIDYSGKNPRCAEGCPEDTRCDYDECPGRSARPEEGATLADGLEVAAKLCERHERNYFIDGRDALRFMAECFRATAAIHAQSAPSPQASQDDYKWLYHELLYAVGNKWPNETRHQTALRYIQQAENNAAASADAMPSQCGPK